MHLDAALGGGPARLLVKGRQGEIRAALAVGPDQRVPIERSRDTLRIVIGRDQRLRRLGEVDADDHPGVVAQQAPRRR